MSKNKHALVIGGSMAGLMAARVLSDHFERVTVVERDKLPQSAEYRSGVPQARHIHILLAGGRKVMQQYFPDFASDLRALGVPEVDMHADGGAVGPEGWGRRFQSGIVSNAISRITLEWYVCSQVKKLPNITFLEQSSVRKLIASEDGGTIIGIELENRANRNVHMLIADLIVDASGRGSKAYDWLASLGYDSPSETVVNSHLGYVTRWYQLTEDHKADWNFMIVEPGFEEGKRRAAAALIVENRKMVLTLQGYNKEYPPTDEVGFLDFVRQLDSPMLYEFIKGLEPISPIYSYRRTENRWRHYEKLTRCPDGFVVIGDAYCGFNPSYGQGMSIAALEAQQLDKLLKRRDLTGFPKAYYRALAKKIRSPWLLSTNADFFFPLTEGERPGRLDQMIHKYLNRVYGIAHDDEFVTITLSRIANLLSPIEAIFHPTIVFRLVSHLGIKKLKSVKHTLNNRIKAAVSGSNS